MLGGVAIDGENSYAYGSGRFRVDDKKNPEPAAYVHNEICGNTTLTQ